MSILRATHTTMYMYSEPVSICHTEVHLAPRNTARQAALEHELAVHPAPDFSLTRKDYFGNEVTYFSLHEPHEALTITATSQVEMTPEQPPAPELTVPWELVRDEIRKEEDEGSFEAHSFAFESPRVPIGRAFAEFAAASFAPGRPILEAASSLSQLIFREFEYDPRATTVTTPVEQVLKTRHGVCQDFAHLMISCLRSLGLAARYISGYLISGKDTKGAEASHAWVSVYCPGAGWIDLDPTNNVMPNGSHITVAWGRDYSDVTPVRGVALGGGEQIITVSVEVKPVQAVEIADEDRD